MIDTIKRLLFGEPKSSHEHSWVRACIWHTNPLWSDTFGRSWDGAYTDFCPRCGKFRAEVNNAQVYESNADYIRLAGAYPDNATWDVADQLSEWLQIDDFREQFKWR